MLVLFSFLVLVILVLLDFFLNFLFILPFIFILVEFIHHNNTSISLQRPFWSSLLHFKSFKVLNMFRILCRIRFCTQEICVFRGDLFQQLTTHALNSTLITDVNECVWVYEELNVVGEDSTSSRNVDSPYFWFDASFSCSWAISSFVSVAWSCSVVLCCFWV